MILIIQLNRKNKNILVVYFGTLTAVFWKVGNWYSRTGSSMGSSVYVMWSAICMYASCLTFKNWLYLPLRGFVFDVGTLKHMWGFSHTVSISFSVFSPIYQLLNVIMVELNLNISKWCGIASKPDSVSPWFKSSLYHLNNFMQAMYPSVLSLVTWG